MNAGDYVRITKSKYPHEIGVCGTVDQAYETECVITADIATLRESIAYRHLDMQSKAAPTKDFQYKYNILVANDCLEPATKKEGKPVDKAAIIKEWSSKNNVTLLQVTSPIEGMWTPFIHKDMNYAQFMRFTNLYKFFDVTMEEIAQRAKVGQGPFLLVIYKNDASPMPPIGYLFGAPKSINSVGTKDRIVSKQGEEIVLPEKRIISPTVKVTGTAPEMHEIGTAVKIATDRKTAETALNVTGERINKEAIIQPDIPEQEPEAISLEDLR